MANIALRSTDGSDAYDGSDWDNAKATLSGAVAVASADDTICMSDQHNELMVATMTCDSPGAFGTPLKLVSVDDAVWPPVALSSGGRIYSSTARTLKLRGFWDIWNVTLEPGGNLVLIGTGVNDRDVFFQRLTNCLIKCTGNAAVYRFTVGLRDVYARLAYGSAVELRDTTIYSYGGRTANIHTRFSWRGGGLTNGDLMFSQAADRDANPDVTLLENLDLTSQGTNPLFNVANNYGVRYHVHRCRLASSAVMTTGTIDGPGGDSLRMIACDDGTNFIRQLQQDYNGTVTEDTVRIRDNSDSSYSHKLVSSANTKFYSPLRSFPVARYNATEGSAITVRVEVLTDGVTLTDGEFWIEANYLGSASYPLGSIESSAKSDILASASNLATSSEDWTTTDLSSPTKQYAEVTFTPQESGIIEITACLAKASTTVYVDPDMTVS